jgi:hypothetical protein
MLSKMDKSVSLFKAAAGPLFLNRRFCWETEMRPYENDITF